MKITGERDERFEVFNGHLERKVNPARGAPYQHRCSLASFEQVAHAINECGDKGFTLESLVEQEGQPFTQVAVALAFLKERGIVKTRYRQSYAATGGTHLDAMTEFHALAVGA